MEVSTHSSLRSKRIQYFTYPLLAQLFLDARYKKSFGLDIDIFSERRMVLHSWMCLLRALKFWVPTWAAMIGIISWEANEEIIRISVGSKVLHFGSDNKENYEMRMKEEGRKDRNRRKK